MTPKSTKKALCCVGARQHSAFPPARSLLSPASWKASPLLATGLKFQHVFICACPLKQEENLQKWRGKKGGQVGVSYLGELNKTQKAQSVTTEKE